MSQRQLNNFSPGKSLQATRTMLKNFYVRIKDIHAAPGIDLKSLMRGNPIERRTLYKEVIVCGIACERNYFDNNFEFEVPLGNFILRSVGYNDEIRACVMQKSHSQERLDPDVFYVVNDSLRHQPCKWKEMFLFDSTLHSALANGYSLQPSLHTVFTAEDFQINNHPGDCDASDMSALCVGKQDAAGYNNSVGGMQSLAYNMDSGKSTATQNTIGGGMSPYSQTGSG